MNWHSKHNLQKEVTFKYQVAGVKDFSAEVLALHLAIRFLAPLHQSVLDKSNLSYISLYIIHKSSKAFLCFSPA